VLGRSRDHFGAHGSEKLMTWTALEKALSLGGFSSSAIGFCVEQNEGAAVTGRLNLAGIMLLEPTGEIIGHADVQLRVLLGAEYVNEKSHVRSECRRWESNPHPGLSRTGF
jgi:hypothetical protein